MPLEDLYLVLLSVQPDKILVFVSLVFIMESTPKCTTVCYNDKVVFSIKLICAAKWLNLKREFGNKTHHMKIHNHIIY